MKEAKVAIYMSCYNHERFVEEAVNSILAQSYTNWELYVVNDGSTDRSGEILESFQDERIHYFSFEQNTRFIGASNFLQKQIRNLEVDYIALLASDDMWKKDKLKKQIDILQAHPEYKSCFTWDELLFCETEDDVYRGHESYSHFLNKNRFDWLNHFSTIGNCLNACSMLMDKDTFYELGGMNEYFIQLGDLRLWIKLSCHYPFYLIEEPLTYYRRHSTNLSNFSEETALKSKNEAYHILYDSLIAMDCTTFRRTFYQRLPFVFCDSHEELLAAKFFMAAGLCTAKGHQIATDIYYDNCDNELFTSILEKNYHFGPGEFIDFAGRGGMQLSFIAESAAKKIFHADKSRTKFFLNVVLLKSINEGLLNKESISWFSYSTLLDAFQRTREDKKEIQQLETINTYLKSIRIQRSLMWDSHNIFFFIAENSDFDVVSFIQSIDNNSGDQYAVSYIPPMQDLFLRDSEECTYDFGHSRVEYINLVNKEQKCLFFLDELNLEADVIYYVDCLGAQYECGKMLAGYSLGVEMNCILKQESYQIAMKENQEELAAMNQVLTY